MQGTQVRFTTFEECCQHLSISSEIPDFSTVPEQIRTSIVAYYMLQIIAKAHNNGWVADYNNYNQRKYTPWFEFSGGAWSYVDCGSVCTLTNVGARLVYKDWETAKYVAETFISLYKDFLG